MSMVLDALEKAQREGKRVAPPPIDRVLRDAQEPGLEKDSVPKRKGKVKTLHRPRRRIFIFGSILLIVVINLIFLGWWLNHNNSSITVDIPTVSKPRLPKTVPINLPRRTPPLDVTGIVWDQKQPIALVNGKFLKVGDEILGARIVDIQLKEVRFLCKDKEFTISVE